jgi:V8-like Glu-specific endopeptidase
MYKRFLITKTMEANMNKKTLFVYLFFLIHFFFISIPCIRAEGIVGKTASVNFSTTHPYKTYSVGEVVESYVVERPYATFMTVHFTNVSLNERDYIEIRDKDGILKQVITNTDPSKSDFWTHIVDEDTIYIELISGSQGGQAYGFDIDHYGYGIIPKSVRSLCGSDTKVDAECIKGTPQYNHSRSVGRMFYQKGENWYRCTGFLISNENHFLSNEHCVNTEDILDTLQVRFNYKYTRCNGDVVTSYDTYYGDDLLVTDENYDTSLMTLSGNPQLKYGFQDIDPRDVTLYEEVYIFQYPQGEPLQYAEGYVVDEVANGWITGSDFGYRVDTEGGSSGSPVISMIDHRVIGLHHFGGCDSFGQNQGVLMKNIYPIIAPYLSDNNYFSTPELWVDYYGYEPDMWCIEKHPRLMADVNGDNLKDIVGFGNEGVYVSLSTGTAFTTPVLWTNNFGYTTVERRPEKYLRMMADVNGDGKADIVCFRNIGVYVSLSLGYTFTSPQLWVNGFGHELGVWEVEKHPRMMADVNGDNRADVIGFGNEGVYVSISSGNSFSSPRLWVSYFGYEPGEWEIDKHPRMMADVDNDGRADVVGFGNTGVYVSLSKGNYFTPPKKWTSDYRYDTGDWSIEKCIRTVADVNGDGRADVVGFGNEGVYVSLSTGSSFTSAQRWVDYYGYNAGDWRVDKHPRMMADVNGDGMADIVGFGSVGGYVSLSTNSRFTEPKVWVNYFGYDITDWNIYKHIRTIEDVNGDGRGDIVAFGNEGVYVALSVK